MGDTASYLPVILIIAMAIGFAIVNVVASMLLGPRVEGAVKGLAYESGMDAIGTSRKRFNVRFYILAMTFLVFDVETVFLFPWALSLKQLPLFVVLEGILFLSILVAGLVYAWRKGMLEWV